jgi:hypothetical protein
MGLPAEASQTHRTTPHADRTIEFHFAQSGTLSNHTCQRTNQSLPISLPLPPATQDKFNE